MKITTQGKKRLIAELILVVLILAVALPFIIFYATRPRGTTARVKVDGKLVGEYSLSVNAEYSLNGGILMPISVSLGTKSLGILPISSFRPS